MNNKYLKLVVMLFGLAVAPLAQASFLCTGMINFLGVGRDGGVYLSNGFGVWNVCNLTATVDGAPADTCKAWYASMQSAQKAGAQVRVYFNHANDVANGAQCGAVGNWVSPGSTLYFIDFLAS